MHNLLKEMWPESALSLTGLTKRIDILLQFTHQNKVLFTKLNQLQQSPNERDIANLRDAWGEFLQTYFLAIINLINVLIAHQKDNLEEEAKSIFHKLGELYFTSPEFLKMAYRKILVNNLKPPIDSKDPGLLKEVFGIIEEVLTDPSERKISRIFDEIYEKRKKVVSESGPLQAGDLPSKDDTKS